MPPFVSQRIPALDLPEFLRLARERFTFAQNLDAEDRALAESDVRFAAALPLAGGGTTQWDAGQARARLGFLRPCLTENRLPTFTAQVVNDGRQSKPSIRITAMDRGTKQTAEYIQGRIRQVEYDSNADTAYDTVREQQVSSGRGFIRVRWEYEPKTFRRRPVIEAIPNQFSVIFGPSWRYDCTDADYCFVLSLVTKEEHARRYGKETTAYRIDFASDANPAPGWLGTGPNGELIQVAEYWLKEYKKRTLCLLSNGETYWQDEIPDELAARKITVKEKREEQDCTVIQYIIDGADILDETEFIGQDIPLVPVWGREQYVDGHRHTASLIRYAKDPQKLLNLYVSNIAEQIAQMPKSPWMVPVGAIPAGEEKVWESLNTDPRAYFQYNLWNAQGQQLAPPHRIVNEPPIVALVNGYNQCVDAIKAAMGIFDASLGNRSNETSGVAIDSRKRESDNSNFHFHDNEARSRKQVGRLLLPLIREFDKGKGDRPIRTEDGKVKLIHVGEPWKDPETNETVHHQLDVGDYAVAVSTGPSYTSQRKEAFDTYWQIAKADKMFMSVAGDKVFRASDFPGSDEIADRYEKLLPEAIRPQKGGPAQIPPAMMQKFAQIQQVAGDTIEQLTARVKQLESDIDAQTVQVESRERIAAMQEETKRLIAVGTLNQKEGLTLLESELSAIKHRLELQQAEEDRQHAARQAEADRQQTAQQAEADRQQTAQQGQADQQQAEADRQHAASESQLDRNHQLSLQQQQAAAAADQAAAAAEVKPQPVEEPGAEE